MLIRVSYAPILSIRPEIHPSTHQHVIVVILKIHIQYSYDENTLLSMKQNIAIRTR